VVPNLRLPSKSRSRRVRRVIARRFYGELDYYEKKSKFISKIKQNDRENIITKLLFIDFKHTGAVAF
jgi:hypothetical protein